MLYTKWHDKQSGSSVITGFEQNENRS